MVWDGEGWLLPCPLILSTHHREIGKESIISQGLFISCASLPQRWKDQEETAQAWPVLLPTQFSGKGGKNQQRSYSPLKKKKKRENIISVLSSPLLFPFSTPASLFLLSTAAGTLFHAYSWKTSQSIGKINLIRNIYQNIQIQTLRDPKMSQCCESPKRGSHFPCLAPCPAQTPRPDVCNSQNVTGAGTAQGMASLNPGRR